MVDNKKCKESYGDIIKETNICAIGMEGQGTCQVPIIIIPATFCFGRSRNLQQTLIL